MLYLAIDQHRKQLTVNLRNEAGDVITARATKDTRLHFPFHLLTSSIATSPGRATGVLPKLFNHVTAGG